MPQMAPHSPENEKACLGSMILNQAIAVEVLSILQTGDFYAPNNGRIFAAIAKVIASGVALDALAVDAALGSDSVKVGGIDYLHDCHQATPNPLSGPHYAHRIADDATRRRLIEAGAGLQLAATDRDRDIAGLTDLAEQTVLAATRSADRREAPSDIATVGAGSLARLRHRVETGEDPGIPTGLKLYDDLVVHRPGQMIVFGGRPGNGKSTITQQIAKYAAQTKGLRAAIMSTEMTQDDMIYRVVSDLASIDSTKIERANLTATDLRRLDAAEAQWRTWNLDLVDWCHTWPGIRNYLRRYAMRHNGIDLFVIDFLQAILPDDSERRIENRNLLVGRWADEIKTLALELSAVALVASQLRRENDRSTPKPPTMSDLRESGNIEQSADVVALLHRPEKYNPDDKPAIVEIHVEKHRRGPTDTIDVRAELMFSRFTDAPTPPTNRDQNRQRPRQEPT